MHDTAPRCWNNCDPELPGCLRCPYYKACLLCTQTEQAFQRPLGGRLYDDSASWAVDPAEPPRPHDEEISEQDRFDLASFLRFLFGLDGYTLGILGEIFAPSRPDCPLSVSELARIHGISRQGMHRKMLRAVRRTPELANLLGLTVRKIRQAKREFAAPPQCRVSAPIRQRM